MRHNQPPLKAVLLERDGRYYFFDSHVGVIASGSTVEQAYQKFTEMREAHAREIESAGLDARINPERSGEVVMRQGFGRELALFAAKFCVALIIIGVVGLPLAAGVARGVSAALSQAAASIQPISLADIAQKAADIARDAQNLSPEKKETLRQSISTIKRELAPVIDAWVNPPDALPPSNR